MRLSHVSAETLSFVHRFGQQTFRSDPRELIDVYQVRLLRNRRPNVTSWGYRTFAEPFTSAISAHLTQIDIGLTTFVGTSGYAGYSEEIIVSLALNDGGMLGKTLASWDLTNLDLPVFGTASNSVTTISNILGVHLKAGESYYLLLSPANSM